MRASSPPAVTAVSAVSNFRKQARGILPVSIGASLLLHAAALAFFPGLATRAGAPPLPAFDVTLLAPVPLPVAPVAAAKSDAAGRAAEIRSDAAPARTTRPPAPAAQPAATEQHFSAVPALPAPEAPSPRDDVARADPAPAPAPAARDTAAPHKAAYLHSPPPAYPLSARRNGEQGTVTLRVLVARDGAPAAVSVERSSGYAHLDRSALDAVRAWRFVPARVQGEPVEVWMLVPIAFRLEGAS